MPSPSGENMMLSLKGDMAGLASWLGEARMWCEGERPGVMPTPGPHPASSTSA